MCIEISSQKDLKRDLIYNIFLKRKGHRVVPGKNKLYNWPADEPVHSQFLNPNLTKEYGQCSNTASQNLISGTERFDTSNISARTTNVNQYPSILIILNHTGDCTISNQRR